jgi:nitrite reductase/ring-hydroxylating ferredoxin subunit
MATSRDTAVVMPIPEALRAPGTDRSEFEPACRLEDLPVGAMRRVTRGDLDVLVAHTTRGILAIEDRCPHMAAPLSLGRLADCIIDCPLHQGRFDLATGDIVRFPTTGGLDADGAYHATWAPPGAPGKPEASDSKARARAATRVRRMRYYPVRVSGDVIEIALPV